MEPTTDLPGPAPGYLVGTWRAAEGQVEDVLRIRADGSYERTVTTRKDQAAGTWTLTTWTAGTVNFGHRTLTFYPSRGRETLRDPDTPGNDYTDRPLTKLESERVEWEMTDRSSLSLLDDVGWLVFARV